MTTILLWALFRTTLVLTLCGGICFLALRKFEHHLPKLSRLLWVAVLLTGWFWLQPVIQIPVTHESRERNNVERPDDATDTQETVFTKRHEATAERDYVFTPLYATEALCETNRGLTGEPVTSLRYVPGFHFIIFTIWLTGMLITIFLAAAGYIRILLLLRNTEPAEDALPGVVRVLSCPRQFWYNGVNCLPIFPIFRHDRIFN